MAKATNPTIQVVPTVIRKWYLEDGTEVRKVSNPEDYASVIRVKKDDATTSYVRLEDYVPSVRVSAGQDDMIAAGEKLGVSAEQAAKMFQLAKELAKARK